jgi:hypothetical protein
LRLRRLTAMTWPGRLVLAVSGQACPSVLRRVAQHHQHRRDHRRHAAPPGAGDQETSRTAAREKRQPRASPDPCNN